MGAMVASTLSIVFNSFLIPRIVRGGSINEDEIRQVVSSLGYRVR